MDIYSGRFDSYYFPSFPWDKIPLNIYVMGYTHGNPDFFTVAGKPTPDSASTYYQFEYVTEGKGYIEINSVTHTVEKGDFFFIRKGNMRTIWSDKKEPLKKLFISVKGDLIEGLLKAYNLTDTFFSVKIDMECNFQRMMDLFARAEGYSPEVLVSVSEELLKIINKVYLHNLALKEKTDAENNFANSIIRYISENIGRKITIQELCKTFYIGKTKLHQFFKSNFGTTPMQYILQLRIQAAKYYLAKTDIRIADIPELIGISDAKYFSKVFKTETKMTPRQFRQNYINNNIEDEITKGWIVSKN